MQVCLDFLAMLTDFLAKVLDLYIFNGVTLKTILFYNFFLVVFFTAFSRRS